MKEVDLRKWHRTIGIIVALFIVLQGGSGFLLSLNDLPAPRIHTHEEAYSTGHDHEEGDSLWHDALEFVHLGGGTIGTVYRLLLGFGIAVTAVSGGMLFFKIRARSKKG